MKDWKEFENDLKDRLKKIKQESFVEYGTLRTFYEYDYVELPFDNEFIPDFIALYRESARDYYHWQYCMLDVYKSNFNKRFAQYRENYPDAELIDFVNDELESYKKEYFVIDVDYDEETGKKYASLSTLKYAYGHHDIEFLLGVDILKMLSMTQDKKISYLESLKNSQVDSISDNTNPQAINDFPEIFTEGNYHKFILLNEKYKKNNNKPKAKYSNLYHFMNYEGMLCCTQSEYIDFIIEQDYIDTISKIQPQSNTYKDTIQPLLARYLKVQA